jgi:hypothetical protein
VLNRVLRGYPLHRISVPSILIQLKRPAIRTSRLFPALPIVTWKFGPAAIKQRAVFTTYLLRVQGQLVDIMRSNTTNIFKNDVSEQLFDGKFLTTIEDDASGYLPFDLVVYLLNFSQYVVPQSTWIGEESSMFSLANTSQFVTTTY